MCSFDNVCSETRISASITSSRIPEESVSTFLGPRDSSIVRSSVINTYNLKERQLSDLDGQNTKDILDFVHALKHLVGQADIIKGHLHGSVADIKHAQRELESRVWFHYHVALNGVRRTLQQGFVEAWDEVFHHLLRPLYANTEGILRSVEKVIQRFLQMSQADSKLRDSYYVVMEQRLSEKMELSIQSLNNLTEVYYSFLNMEPTGSYILTPGRRYDSDLIPRRMISAIHDKLKEIYGTLSDNVSAYVERVRQLKTTLRNVYMSSAINQTMFSEQRNSFRAASSEVERHSELFEERVFQHLSGLGTRHMEHFKKMNNTFHSAAADVTSLLEEAATFFAGGFLEQRQRLENFAEDAEQYLALDDKKKSDLADKWLQSNLRLALAGVTGTLDRLRVHDIERQQVWKRYRTSLQNIWEEMLSNRDLESFYAQLYQDTRRMNTEPHDLETYYELYAHPKMLGKSPMELRDLPLEEFYTLLNADFNLTNPSRKSTEIASDVASMRRTTDVTLMMGDREETLRSAFQKLDENLDQFEEHLEVGPEFVR